MEEEENKEVKEDFKNQLNEQVENKIQEILDVNVSMENIDYLSKLVDIHKDLENEKYWKIKEEVKYMYRGEYGNYPMYEGGRRRDSRGRYMDGNSYGRRGVPDTGRGRYRGEDAMDRMMEHYGDYNELKDMYNEGGNYNAKEDSKHSLHKMLKSAEEFFQTIVEQADSPEEIEMVKETAHRISEM